MTLREIVLSSGGALFAFLTILQITPIKINPWTSIAKALGKAINTDVLQGLAEVKEAQAAAQRRLDEHIKADDERDADRHREKILQFNNELLRDIPHTREDFIEILAAIDAYERYCKTHADYQNNRAVHAIANIGRVYDARLTKHDFMKE